MKYVIPDIEFGNATENEKRTQLNVHAPTCFGAVSYTHLDVYKRQAVGREK